MALTLLYRVVLCTLERGALLVLRLEPVLRLLPHEVADRASNVGMRCELLWAAPCDCHFRRHLHPLGCLFGSLDIYMPWYPVNLNLCTAVGQLLGSPDDASVQPLSWAGVHVLHSLDGYL